MPPLGRHLKAAFTERLGYKAAALFFAVVLWLVVSAEEPSEELVPVRLEAAYDTVRIMTSTRPVIRALVAGRARDLLKLYDTPPVVRRVITDDAPDSVAVELKPTDVYIPPNVDAIVRDVQPRTLLLVFDVTTSRRVPIVNAVRVVPDTTDLGRTSRVSTQFLTRLVPDTVTVTGPRRAVGMVTRVKTAERTIAVRDSGEFTIPVNVSGLGAGVVVRPAEVKLIVYPGPIARLARDSARVTALKPK